MTGIATAAPLPFPLNPLAGRPRVDAAEAADIVRRRWGMGVAVEPLPGERDRNFLVTGPDGARFVLKISSRSEPAERVELQEELIRCVRERDPTLRLPEAVPLADGRTGLSQPCGADACAVRLFRYTQGVPLSGFRRRPPALLESVGRLAGRLQRALDGFDHPGLDRQEIPWAPRHAPGVIAAADTVLPGGRKRLYRRVADSVEADLQRLLALPAVALHNDANDDNLLLCDETPETATPGALALLDFGDAVSGPAICEAATAAVYVAAGALEPLAAAAQVLEGFARERPVAEEEAALFRGAVAARSLVSAGVAALRRAEAPEAAADSYLMVSETAVWRLLEALDAEPAVVTSGRFRIAAGHPALPGLAGRLAALHRAAAGATPPLAMSPDRPVLDLSPASPATDPAAVAETLGTAVAAAGRGGGTPVGRYLEPRAWELPSRAGPDRPLGEPATIQLGTEFFTPPGTPVRAPLAGTVAWIGGAGDATGEEAVVGLRHGTEEGAFWTWHRNLDRERLAPLRLGAPVRQGESLGVVAPGAPGGWPPHLQFQVSLTPEPAPPPLRSSAADLPLLAALNPDPTGLAGLGPAARVSPEGREQAGARLLESRRRRFSRALSISYEAPIRVVRGRGARLYDDAGRDYLDLVNNVCHVGHAHPRVAEAIARQAALLNTNTRYLYPQLTRYAEHLTETLPAPLEVVFLTNSGSEANDLALRIARTRLGRPDTLVFDGGYHGNLTALIEVSPYKLDGAGGGPGPPWLHRLPMPDGFRGRFRDTDPDFPGSLIADAEARVERAGPCALIGEAILSCGGQIAPPPGYLGALYRAVRKAGGVVIADEVQTGFGRVGPDFWAFMAMQRPEPVECPDIVTLGKPAGNGHPLGAVVTTRELARSFETGMEYFNTFGGNPVSCAAGLAVLDVLREERLPEHAETTGALLLAGLRSLANRYPILGDVRGRGLFLGFEMVRDPVSREPAGEEARRLVNRLRELRMLSSTDGPEGNVIKIKPPLVFSASDAARYLDVLEFVLREQF